MLRKMLNKVRGFFKTKNKKDKKTKSGILEKVIRKLSIYTIVVSLGVIMVCTPFVIIDRNKVNPISTVVKISTPFGTGSGVVIKCEQLSNGFYMARILTAAHVVKGSQFVTISFFDGNKVGHHQGEVEFIDSKSDVASVIIHRMIHSVDVAHIANLKSFYSDMNPGDTMYGVGCGFGFRPTMKVGLLSWTSHPNLSNEIISTSVPIIFGDSGGGMFNDKGELVGIINAISIAMGRFPYEHINFITPVTKVQYVFDQYSVEFAIKDINPTVKKLRNLLSKTNVKNKHLVEQNQAIKVRYFMLQEQLLQYMRKEAIENQIDIKLTK